MTDDDLTPQEQGMRALSRRHKAAQQAADELLHERDREILAYLDARGHGGQRRCSRVVELDESRIYQIRREHRSR